MNARDKAPLNATEDYLKSANIAVQSIFISNYICITIVIDGGPGELLISVPGDIKGFYMAWERFGR